MSPTVLRQSGPKYLRDDGVLITPQASVHFCEECGDEDAPFGFTDSHGVRRYYCNGHLDKAREG